MDIRFITQPYQSDGKTFLLGDKLNELLKSKKLIYDNVWFIASFAKYSGISKLKSGIKKAVENGSQINFVLGIGNQLTTAEALRGILDLGCSAKLFRNNAGIGIGAKIYIFEAAGKTAEVFISSGNITEGGLYKNHEMIVWFSYDLEAEDTLKYDEFKISISNILNPKEEYINELNYELINILIDNNEITSEANKKALRKEQLSKATNKEQQDSDSTEDDLFSIELPTGESIEISFGESDNIAEKLEKLTSGNEETKESKANIHENNNQEAQQDEFDIDIEIDTTEKIEEHALEEFLDEDGTNERTSESETHEEYQFVSNVEAIDIEQMLYNQNKFESYEENELDKQAGTISEDDLKIIKSKDVKRPAKKSRIVSEKLEPAVEETVKETVKKKFIITSSFNKAKGGSLVNAYFMQINKVKGRGLSGEVRMPTAARDFSPEFWGWPTNYSISHEDGKLQKKSKKWITNCRVIDVNEPDKREIDTIELFQEEGKTSFNLRTKALISLNPEENDIIRVIRCAEGDDAVFQVELIRAASREYTIWEQFCSQTIKGTERKYGFA